MAGLVHCLSYTGMPVPTGVSIQSSYLCSHACIDGLLCVHSSSSSLLLVIWHCWSVTSTAHTLDRLVMTYRCGSACYRCSVSILLLHAMISSVLLYDTDSYWMNQTMLHVHWCCRCIYHWIWCTALLACRITAWHCISIAYTATTDSSLLYILLLLYPITC